jgi:hypothetical protein
MSPYDAMLTADLLAAVSDAADSPVAAEDWPAAAGIARAARQSPPVDHSLPGFQVGQLLGLTSRFVDVTESPRGGTEELERQGRRKYN